MTLLNSTFFKKGETFDAKDLLKKDVDWVQKEQADRLELSTRG